jgi:hypothetical protein
MINLHLLPTDKPSRLVTTKLSDNLLLVDMTKKAKYKRFHIYITGDIITGFEDNIWVFNNDTVWLWKNTMAIRFDNKPRKVILTTDKDLIDSGIQAIDNKFLQWFVMNSECKEVDVQPLLAGFIDDEPSYYEDMYEIIISEDPCSMDFTGELDGLPNLCDVIKEKNEKQLYSDIELLIIAWNIDGTKTAGSLTRDIMKLL